MHLANETLEPTTLKSGWNLEAFVIIVTYPNTNLRPAKQICGQDALSQHKGVNKIKNQRTNERFFARIAFKSKCKTLPQVDQTAYRACCNTHSGQHQGFCRCG
jgi:hypothetical protein